MQLCLNLILLLNNKKKKILYVFQCINSLIAFEIVNLSFFKLIDLDKIVQNFNISHLSVIG